MLIAFVFLLSTLLSCSFVASATPHTDDYSSSLSAAVAAATRTDAPPTPTTPSAIVTTAEDTAVSQQKISRLLEQVQEWQSSLSAEEDSRRSRRPFVTVAYAQSLDGKIAAYSAKDDSDGGGGAAATTATATMTTSNYPLSCAESLRLTHGLRSIHDGILVGGNTLSVDNPRLSNRLWRSNSTGGRTAASSPRPIVLDTHLVHTLALGSRLRASNPIVCCSEHAVIEVDNTNAVGTPAAAAAFSVLRCRCCRATGRLDLRDVLRRLWEEFGIRSVLVEGGAAVLSSFLQDDHDLVDALCITIAPMLLRSGIAPNFEKRGGHRRRRTKDHPHRPSRHRPDILDLRSDSQFVVLGTDATVLCRFPRHSNE
jgi:riboflavin-specific deaminase-like protein